ncbi:MAG: efflux RND transporter periplasmic adaptor subunit [Terriglobales bacterium]
MRKLILVPLLAAPLVWAGCAAHSASLPATASSSRTVVVAAVRRVQPRLTMELPAELNAYQDVNLQARVAGFIRALHADRGSRVRAGELLAELDAPDLRAKRAEAEHRLSSAQALRVESSAALQRDQATLQRLRGADAAVAGAVAGNDIQVAEQAVAADQAEVQSREAAEKAASSALQEQVAMTDYLRVVAPFAGTIVRRDASVGALAGPGAPPLFELQQLNPLRLVIDVPEAETVGVPVGARLPFTVSSQPGQTYYGVVARVSNSVRRDTRAMPIELDVANPSHALAPGMFVHVQWSFQRSQPSLFVPATAVTRTSERTFVERIGGDGRLQWVDVRTGFADGNDIEVFGSLAPGDRVVAAADDELRAGQQVTIRP